MSSTSLAHQHEHYDHYDPDMIRRLDGFFGRVDERMNQRITEWVTGPRVLDVGCGFGNLSNHLSSHGFEVTGVDQMEESIVAGKERFPNIDIRFSPAEGFEFADRTFDTVILKDTIHHVYGEADIGAFLAEVKRVCKKRLVIFDPNPTFILLASRKLIGHIDPVCGPQDAITELTKAGFTIRHHNYFDIFAFPLSGGYVGMPLVPFRALWGPTLLLDGLAEQVASALSLSKSLCWRYLIVAEL